MPALVVDSSGTVKYTVLDSPLAYVHQRHRVLSFNRATISSSLTVLKYLPAAIINTIVTWRQLTQLNANCV